MSQAAFYDEVAEYYDLVYADWAGSMKRHGFAISVRRLLDLMGGTGLRARMVDDVPFFQPVICGRQRG